MDILSLAEEYYLISLGIVFGIGLLQGSILGRGVRKRFPKLKTHTRIVSVSLLILFSINAVYSTLNFAEPEKITFDDMSIPQTVEESKDFVFSLLGLDAGFSSVVAIFVSITIVLFLRFAELPSIARYFIFGISVIMMLVAILLRFTDYVPNLFHVLFYASYQVGITIGIFIVTRRKDPDTLYAFE